MKRVGFVLKGYPRVSETFIAQEIYLLEQRGFEIEIFSMRQAREPQRQPIVAKIRAPVTYIPEYIWPAWRTIAHQSARVFIRRPLRFVQVLAGAAWRSVRQRDDDPLKRFFQGAWLVGYRELLSRKRPVDHLHSHFVHAPTEMTTYISALTDLPYSISAHAKDIYTIPLPHVIERVNRSRLIMTCTCFNYDFLRDLRGIDRDKIQRVYHGVDLATFRRSRPLIEADFARALPNLVSVGRLVPKKGYDIILRALAELKRDGRRFTYEIFGEGELYAELAALVSSLGLVDDVTFHRTSTHPQIIERLDRGGLFLMGSRQTADLDRDGIPNTIAEAMAMEVPVIASRVSGIPELIEDGATGFLFEENDVAGLRRAILHAWDSPSEAYRVARAGRAKVERVFNSEVWIEDCARLLKGVLA